jgi:transposase
MDRSCPFSNSFICLMWLAGRLAPNFKTIADFRHDNSAGIRNVCRRFVMLCRELKLFGASPAALSCIHDHQ